MPILSETLNATTLVLTGVLYYNTVLERSTISIDVLNEHLFWHGWTQTTDQDQAIFALAKGIGDTMNQGERQLLLPSALFREFTSSTDLSSWACLCCAFIDILKCFSGVSPKCISC